MFWYCRDENAYTTAIRAVAEILQDYDYGKYFMYVRTYTVSVQCTCIVQNTKYVEENCFTNPL